MRSPARSEGAGEWLSGKGMFELDSATISMPFWMPSLPPSLPRPAQALSRSSATGPCLYCRAIRRASRAAERLVKRERARAIR
jgi:hypothetical protein